MESRPGDISSRCVAQWLSSCDGSHDGCKAAGPMALPTRLIDVGDNKSGHTLRVVLPKGDEQWQYIALSYCWGANELSISLTINSLLAMRNGVCIEDLPQTIRDTIFLARSIGVRCVWSDRLCILQDDLADWERESKMSSVYANAYLTVSATGSDSSSRGLFKERTPRTSLRQPFTSSDNVSGQVLMYPLPVDKEYIKHRYIEMKAEPLSQRGRAFQERLLSRRVLHYASDQMYFECLQGMVSEDGLSLPDRFLSMHIAPDCKDSDKSITPLQLIGERSKTSPAMDRWLSCLMDYGPRDLKFPGDKLPAISGIAKAHQEQLQDEYVAGLWRGSMIEGLCWHTLDGKAVADYRAPSWSWASLDCTPNPGLKGRWEAVANARRRRRREPIRHGEGRMAHAGGNATPHDFFGQWP